MKCENIFYYKLWLEVIHSVIPKPQIDAIVKEGFGQVVAEVTLEKTVEPTKDAFDCGILSLQVKDK